MCSDWKGFGGNAEEDAGGCAANTPPCMSASSSGACHLNAEQRSILPSSTVSGWTELCLELHSSVAALAAYAGSNTMAAVLTVVR